MKRCDHCQHEYARKPKKCGQCGGSAFTDFFTKTIPSAAKTAWNKGIKPAAKWIKDRKLISKGLNMIPDPRAKVAGGVADAVGLGKKRRTKKPAKKAMIGMGKRAGAPRMISM